MRDFRSLDRENHGFMLQSDLNKVFKSHYSLELEGKTLTKAFRPFQSIQNKDLIDYKKLQNHLNQQLKEGQVMPQKIRELISSPVSPKEAGRRVEMISNEILQQAYLTNSGVKGTSRNEDFRKSFTEMKVLPSLEEGHRPIPLVIGPQGKRTQNQSLNRIVLDPIKFMGEGVPKTSESPKQNRGRKSHFESSSPASRNSFAMNTAYNQFKFGFQSSQMNLLDFIKKRLAYEWKNIYRTLAQIDLNNSGSVTINEFSNAVSKNRTYMTKEELKKLQAQFGSEGSDLINYNLLSQQLGLHKTSMDFMNGVKAKNVEIAAKKVKALQLSQTNGFDLGKPIP